MRSGSGTPGPEKFRKYLQSQWPRIMVSFQEIMGYLMVDSPVFLGYSAFQVGYNKPDSTLGQLHLGVLMTSLAKFPEPLPRGPHQGQHQEGRGNASKLYCVYQAVEWHAVYFLGFWPPSKLPLSPTSIYFLPRGYSTA